MDGILLVDKPAGWTSHDVVAKVRSVIKTQTGQKVKVGHAGTLDPFATGLLVLVIGSYTKRASEFSRLDKTYEAEITLGATSTTGDTEGKISSRSTEIPFENEIKTVIKSFIGDISQKPHPYSAVKVGGQRAYKLARKGEIPDLKPRKVTIYEINNTRYEYPNIWLKTRVSSGTYIRTLAEDIGQKLGTGAYLSFLRRDEVGKFKIEQSILINDLTPELINMNLQK